MAVTALVLAWPVALLLWLHSGAVDCNEPCTAYQTLLAVTAWNLIPLTLIAILVARVIRWLARRWG